MSYRAYSYKDDHTRYRPYWHYYHGSRSYPSKETNFSKAWNRLQSFVGTVEACDNFGRYSSGNIKPRNSGGKICLTRFSGKSNVWSMTTEKRTISCFHKFYKHRIQRRIFSGIILELHPNPSFVG